MQFVCITHIWPGFATDLIDRRRIQFAHFFEDRFRQHPPHLNRAGAAFFERRIVQIGVWVRIQNFVRKLRWYRGVHRNAADSAIFHAAEEFFHAFDVHGFSEDVFHDFRNQWMVGNLYISGNVFLASGNIGKD